MKTRLVIAGLFFVAVFIVVCHKNSDAEVTPPMLKTDSTRLSVIRLNVGSIDSFTIISNINWTIAISSATATWLKISAPSGKNNAKIYVTVLDGNASPTAQTASIMISPAEATSTVPSITIPVSQQSFNPHLVSSKLFGGTANDYIYSVVRSSDGGYVGAGKTLSSDGDAIGGHGSSDMFIVSVDGNGNKLWRTVLGGSNNDGAQSIAATSDGGYVVAGYTSSNNSGDVGANHGSFDMWIVKLNGNGDIVWNKLFGGSSADGALSVAATSDGGYAIAGYTFSNNNGDVGSNHGDYDMWVVKLNGQGDKLWGTTLGGSSNEQALSIVATSDDGYAVTGFTGSNNNGDVGNNHGGNDMFIAKIDRNGNKVWTKVLGGFDDDRAESIVATSDGGYVVGGRTNSNNNGDVSNNHGLYDIWVVKLDANGEKIWANTYGGSNDDGARSIVASTDGGYVIAGYTESNDDDVSGKHRSYDILVAKIDRNGRKLWAKQFGGDGIEEARSIIVIADGGYTLAGYSFSNNGDFSDNHGGFDGFLMKISER